MQTAEPVIKQEWIDEKEVLRRTGMTRHQMRYRIDRRQFPQPLYDLAGKKRWSPVVIDLFGACRDDARREGTTRETILEPARPQAWASSVTKETPATLLETPKNIEPAGNVTGTGSTQLRGEGQDACGRRTPKDHLEIYRLLGGD